jgi:hypothetical protein
MQYKTCSIARNIYHNPHLKKICMCPNFKCFPFDWRLTSISMAQWIRKVCFTHEIIQLIGKEAYSFFLFLGPTLKGNMEKPIIKPLISVPIMFELWLVFNYCGVFGRLIPLIFCKLGFNFGATNGFFSFHNKVKWWDSTSFMIVMMIITTTTF